MLAAKRFEVSGRVDVGHRRNLLVRIQHRLQFGPGAAHVAQVRHIGHGTPSGEIRQDHDLVVAGQNVGNLGHEVNTAEHDVLRIRFGGHGRQLERVATDVGMRKHFVALVVMPEDHQAIPQSGFGRTDAGVALLVAQCRERVQCKRCCCHGDLLWR